MTGGSIELINCDQKILEAILDGDQSLSQLLNIHVPKKWSEFGMRVFKFSLERISEKPETKKWWTYLPVEKKSNTLIGSCGFKGPPLSKTVEIGYEVCQSFRNKGFATEITNLLTEIAFKDNRVNTIKAQTKASNKASAKVLQKCNFKFIKESLDPDDELIFEWVKKNNCNR